MSIPDVWLSSFTLVFDGVLDEKQFTHFSNYILGKEGVKQIEAWRLHGITSIDFEDIDVDRAREMVEDALRFAIKGRI